MNKEEFLAELKKELNNAKLDSKSLIAYYDELISERIDAGEKEKDIIKSIGDIKTLVKTLKLEKALDEAKVKPSVPAGTKVLLAILSLFSLPVLLPLLIVFIVLILCLFIVIISLMIAFGSAIFGVGAFIFAAIATIFHSGLGIGILLIVIGSSIFMITWFIQLIIWLSKLMKYCFIKIIDFINRKLNERKEVKAHE